MEKLKTLLVANRGEIAVRIIRTAKRLRIKTIAIYTAPDALSQHVRAADEAVILPGAPSTAYTDSDAIISIAKKLRVDAIIPGYGFLSENAAFARAVADAGMVWVGPSPEAIEAFGIKHTARELAQKAGVPIVPGTEGLVESADAAVKAANELGYPVMVKATGGGGGMGLVTCHSDTEVRKGFETATSRAESLFKNPGVFLEKFYPEAHHIEVQVFGNGQGKVIHFGERECSIQRRHQKVIEECPSPFVTQRHPELRKKLGDAAVRLAESINYGSAGTVECLVDDHTGDFFFLEMNTRLQVEHGITEMCYGVDLVEMMLIQAMAQLDGQAGVSDDHLETIQKGRLDPEGFAIEARVYAEIPIKDYAPSPGVLQEVRWADMKGVRLDTWVERGLVISPNYDPLIAKAMFYDKHSRKAAVDGLEQALSESVLQGPPTNLDFLVQIMKTPKFRSGDTITNFLHSFEYAPAVIDVLSAGAYTLVQDYPARPAVMHGIPNSGPMDPFALQLANILVGNRRGKEALEITLNGPHMRFLQPAVVALCGAPMTFTIGGKPAPMWTRLRVEAGQRLKIGKLVENRGCRSYLAVFGGFPSVAEYFGSKATSPLVGIGGLQGRALAPGDVLEITSDLSRLKGSSSATVPESLRPHYHSNEEPMELLTMVGPHDEGYLTPEDSKMIYETTWKVSHNANRSGVRLIGPVPKWARKDGGQGGSHPSNLVEYGYPMFALNWTGDDPCFFPFDCPNFGGFLSSTTVITAHYRQLGQAKAGDQLKMIPVSLQEAVTAREDLERFLNEIEAAVQNGSSFENIQPLRSEASLRNGKTEKGDAVIAQTSAKGTLPDITYRQGGDRYVIVEYGRENFDLNYKVRVMELEKALKDPKISPIQDSLITMVGCCTSLTIAWDSLKLPRADLISHLQQLESKMGDLSTTLVPVRQFRMPITFDSKEQNEATKKYMETQRPYAPYLPSNLEFVAKNNAFTSEKLKSIYTEGTLAAVVVGFYCGNTVSLPVDPRERMSCPKLNPSRVDTPSGTVGWGGSCCSIYPVASPGGYQMCGRTIPIFDQYGSKPGFSPERPWLLQAFDLLTFEDVGEDEMNRQLELWESGRYEHTWTETKFDMREHNQLLEKTAAEVEQIRKEQLAAQEKMMEQDKRDIEKWKAEKEKDKVDEGTVEKLLEDPTVEVTEAPVNANVWKVLVEEGQEIQQGDDILILEAMKLEVSVQWGGGGDDDDEVEEVKDKESRKTVLGKKGKVVKVIARPGETVAAGEKLVLVRSA